MGVSSESDPASAIVRAFESGRAGEAIALFRAAGGELFSFVHGYDDLGRVLSAMPDGLWRHHESLLGAYALYLAKRGQAGRARAHLGDPDIAFERTYKSDFIALMLAIHLGDPVSAEQLERWIGIERRLPVSSPLLEGLFYNGILVCLVRHGRLREARTAGRRAIAAYRDAGHIHLEHFIHLHLADLAIMEGRLRDGRRDLATGIRRFRESGRVYGNEERIMEILHLTLDYETGRHDHIPARTGVLRQALLDGDSWVEMYEQLARIAVKSTFFTGGRGAALAELELFRAGYAERHGGVSDVLVLLEVALDRLDWRFGDVEVALAGLDTQRLHSPIGRSLLREVADGGQPGDAAEPPTPRDAIADTLRAARRLTGNPRRRLVEKAFWLAVKEGHAAPFLDHRDVLSGIGTRLSSGRFARGHVQLARLARHTVEAVAASYWMPPALRAFGITHRQFRILSALQSGASNKEIARTLAISEATVKYHLARLYRIFGTARRGELIDRIELIRESAKNHSF